MERLKNEVVFWVHRIAIMVDPRIEMARCYHKVFRSWPNFKEPKSLIEKVYWLQLSADTSLWSLCADKYKVRGYVADKGFGKYLNEIYGVWDKLDDINFDLLPAQCVLKTNNGCGQIVFLDKSVHGSIDDVRKRLRRWLRHPFGVSGGELHYLQIPPKVIAEKVLIVPTDKISLIDYKIWCFSGEPFCILVVYNRNSSTVNLALYDLNWNPMMHYLKSTKHAIVVPDVEMQKPVCLSEMLDLARGLSVGFPEVRVDLYEVEDKPVFGEMTFSTGFGYFTDEFYRILGDKVVLPNKRTSKNKP